MVEADDGERYLVKGHRIDPPTVMVFAPGAPARHLDRDGAFQALTREIVDDHVIARLGSLLDAPVVRPAVVDIPEALLVHPALAHLRPGLALGSRWLAGASDAPSSFYEAIGRSQDVSARLARLIVLWAWIASGPGGQFLLDEEGERRLLYAIDHAFPSDDHNRRALHAGHPVVFHEVHRVQSADLHAALAALRDVTPAQVAAALAAVPDAWLAAEERLALAAFAWARRRLLVAGTTISR